MPSNSANTVNFLNFSTFPLAICFLTPSSTVPQVPSTNSMNNSNTFLSTVPIWGCLRNWCKL